MDAGEILKSGMERAPLIRCCYSPMASLWGVHCWPTPDHSLICHCCLDAGSTVLPLRRWAAGEAGTCCWGIFCLWAWCCVILPFLVRAFYFYCLVLAA